MSGNVPRSLRYSLIFSALWLLMLGGGAYYNIVFEVRVAHHVIMSALMLFWLGGRLRHGQGLPDVRLGGAIVALCAVWVAMTFTALDVRMALEKLWFGLGFVVLFFIIASLIRARRQRLIMETAFIMGLLVTVLTLIELAMWFFGFGIDEVGWLATGLLPRITDIPNLTLAQGNSNLLAALITPISVWALVWGMTARRPLHRLILRFLFGMMLVVIVATASRGALVSLGVALLICGGAYLSFTHRLPAVIRRWQWGIAFIIAGILATGLLFVGWQGDVGRQDMWQSALAMTQDAPLDGMGYGMYGRAFREYRATGIARDHLATAHNLYLNMAAEGGLLLLAVATYALYAYGRAARRAWQLIPVAARGTRLRWWAMLATLIGFAFHSLVDVFTVTSVVLVMLIPLAYTLMHPHTLMRPDASGISYEHPLQPRRSPVFVGILFVVLVFYGLGFVVWDNAQSAYQQSWASDDVETALAYNRQAQNLDPTLALYALHEAFLLGSASDNDTSYLARAHQAYEGALQLEPTWDVGWMNLAWIQEQMGDMSGALASLAQAQAIRGDERPALHIARLREEYAVEGDMPLVQAYEAGIAPVVLPLASWWWDTEARREAVMNFVQTEILRGSTENAFRSLFPHDIERAFALVPATANHASDWMMTGVIARADGDSQGAYDAFTQATDLAPRVGDYWALRASVAPDFARADADLLRAQALGTRHENIGFIRADWAQRNGDETGYLRAMLASVPRISNPQRFSAVLYERPALFSITPAYGTYSILDADIVRWQAFAETLDAIDESDIADSIRAIIERLVGVG